MAMYRLEFTCTAPDGEPPPAPPPLIAVGDGGTGTDMALEHAVHRHLAPYVQSGIPGGYRVRVNMATGVGDVLAHWIKLATTINPATNPANGDDRPNE